MDEVKLDRAQSKIVKSDADKICVIAGAGAGKTRCIIERVRRLLNEGVSPGNIVCITYTNMAAQEMISRLSDLEGYNRMFVGTIHSYAYRILNKSGIHVNILNSSIEDKIARELIKKYSKTKNITMSDYDKWSKKRTQYEFNTATKAELMGCLPEDKIEIILSIVDSFSLYNTIEWNSNLTLDEMIDKALEHDRKCRTAIDFPETVKSVAREQGYITFNEMLNTCAEKAKKRKISYLFVDELQDIGIFEYKFLTKLNVENTFVVGDDYQCQPAETKVLVPDGNFVRISDMNVGDEVLCWDFERNCKTTSTVTEIQISKCDRLINVMLCNGRCTKYTPNHKCFVLRGEKIIECRADEIMLSDKLLQAYKDRLEPIEIYAMKNKRVDEFVYSLDVKGYHNYIGDGFLTHNSIYAFKGADFKLFQSIATDPKFEVHKLSNNYRSQKAIVNYSNEVISAIDDVINKDCKSAAKPLMYKPTIIHKKGNITTVMEYIEKIDSRDYGKWFILCRNNSSVVKLSRMCYHRNIPAVTFKNSHMTYEERSQLMEENSLKLLSIHSAKGLEADNVILFGDFPNLEENSWEYYNTFGKTSEDCRLYYVGVTRARNNLVVVQQPHESEFWSCYEK